MLLYLILVLALYVAYKIYVLVKVPEELKNVPAVPLLTYFRFSMDKRSFRDKVDHYFQSHFNEFGVIRVSLIKILLNFNDLHFIGIYAFRLVIFL
jgi:hypothetical protein